MVIGANSITAYCLAHLIDGFILQSFKTHLGPNIFRWSFDVHLRGVGWAPPEDLPPTTDDFVERQDWLGPDPGIDALEAHERGVRGENIVIADCEYEWLLDHEDLVDADLHREEGAGRSDYGDGHHGTAVVRLGSNCS